MLKTAFYRNKNFASELIGYIVLRGGTLSVIPSGTRLQEVLKRPCMDTEGNILYANKDPEAWLKALPLTYRGSYFWCGDVEEA